MGIIREKKVMKHCSVFHIKQRMKFEKFTCFFIDFLRYSFWENKSYFERGCKRVYTRHNLTDLSCMPIYWFLYDKMFYLTVFPNYSYILENHFCFVYAPEYCFKTFLSWIFCVNSSVKVLYPSVVINRPTWHTFIRPQVKLKNSSL